MNIMNKLNTALCLSVGLALCGTLLSLQSAVAGVRADAVADLLNTAGAPFDGIEKLAVQSSTPEQMLQEYIQARATGVRGGSALEVRAHAGRIHADSNEVGILDANVAQQEFNTEIQRQLGLASSLTPAEQAAARTAADRAVAAFNELIASGVVFGYDGTQQNGCAAATSYLLILDPAGQRVFGLDLEPCHES